MHEKPSKVAAAIMACTRSYFSLNVIYSSQLSNVSGYSLIELKVLMARLKKGVHGKSDE